MSEQRRPALLADAPSIIETPDSEEFGLYLLRCKLPQARTTEDSSVLPSAAHRALLVKVGAVQQQLTDISAEVAVLVKDGSGSTSNAEAQAARLVEMLDRALLALDEVRMPGEGSTPAAVRTARRAAADRALGLAEQLEVSGKASGRQVMRSIRSQRLRSVLRGAPDGCGFSFREAEVQNSISNSLQDRLDASPAGPWDAASFGLAQEVEMQLMWAVTQREEQLQALSQQAASLMAVDSLGRAEREQTMCLLEAVDRVLLSIDEVQAPEGLPMPSGIQAARKTLADDALALATRLEGYLGYSAYSSRCTNDGGGGSGSNGSSEDLLPVMPPQQPQQAAPWQDQQLQDEPPGDDLDDAEPASEEQLYVDPDGDVQAQVNAWMDDHAPLSPLPPLLLQAFAKSGRSLTATKVVPALLAAGGAAGIQQLGPGSRLCVWETSAAAGDGSWQQNAAPLHLAPLLVRYKGLCKWSSENFGLTLPPAAADGRDIVGALRSGVAAVAAEAAPKCIVFVEDDWQPEAGGSMSEVIALWRGLTCSGPRNAVWVLAPRRPLAAWVAMTGGSQGSVDSSFADRVIVLPLVSHLKTGERQAMWKAMCCDITRQGKAAPATELLNAAEAAGVGPALLVTLAQAWPMAGAAWHADALGFTKDYVNRLSIAVGHDWEYARKTLDDDAKAMLRRMITTGATAAEAECLPHIVQTFLKHWEAPNMQGLRAVQLGFSATLIEAALANDMSVCNDSGHRVPESEDFRHGVSESQDSKHRISESEDQTNPEQSPVASSLHSSVSSPGPDSSLSSTISIPSDPDAAAHPSRQRLPRTRWTGRGRPMIPVVRVQPAEVTTGGPAVPAGRLGDTGLGGGGGRAQRGQRVSRLASGTAHRSVPLSNGASQRSRAAGQINGSRNRAAAAGSKPGVNSDDAGSDTSPGNDPASGYGCQSSSDSNNSSSGSSRGSSDLSSEVDSGSPGSLPHSAANDRRPQLQRAGGQRQAQHREPDSIEATFVTALETASGGADNDLAGRHHLVWSRDRLEGDE